MLKQNYRNLAYDYENSIESKNKEVIDLKERNYIPIFEDQDEKDIETDNENYYKINNKDTVRSDEHILNGRINPSDNKNERYRLEYVQNSEEIQNNDEPKFDPYVKYDTNKNDKKNEKYFNVPYKQKPYVMIRRVNKHR